MRVLYISHNGMLEPLGQSQVLPYVRGLADRDIAFDLVSFETQDTETDAIESLRDRLLRENVIWHPLRRARDPRLRVKLSESVRGVATALTTAILRPPTIVHGRSYIPTAIADVIASITPRAKLLFDCRGMLADEYVDAGHWTRDRLEYQLVKTYERRLMRNSDGVVVLTRALETWLRGNGALGERQAVEVVPCCVDARRFRPRADSRARLRREWGLETAFVILYSGSLGSWYLEGEMAQFAGLLRDLWRQTGNDGRVVVVCFTRSDATAFQNALERAGFPRSDVIVRRAHPEEMPEYLSMGDVGLSLIKPCFSKTGSSPTKVAEYLACGNIAAINVDIGDQADLATETDACVGIRGFSDHQLQTAARSTIELMRRPWEQRAAATSIVARNQFGLDEIGIPRYAALYDALTALPARKQAAS